MYPAVNSITLRSNYTATLHLDNLLSATTLELDGGNIDQPNGAYSQLNVQNFIWSAGILNVANQVSNLVINNSATLTGTNLTTKDNLIINRAIVGLYNTGNLTFNDNAGMTLSNGGSVQLWSPVNFVTAGSGIIQNNGGSFIKASDANTTNKCDLPYVNNDQNASLTVDQGTLIFDHGGGPNNVSVDQVAGHILIGLPGAVDPTLEVDKGLRMDNGHLTTANGATAAITGGDIAIHGGYIVVGIGGVSTLNCTGNVTMDGGTYDANVDFAAPAGSNCSLWKAQSFAIRNNASLTVTSLNIPAGGVPSNLHFTIMMAPQGDPAGIDGTFDPANEDLIITPTKSYTAGRNVNNTEFVLTTP